MKSKKVKSKVVINRRARFDYELDQSFTAGLVLTGAEAKSIRLGHASIQGSYCIVRSGEAWLVNMTVSPAKNIAIEEEERGRRRKLLLSKKELAELERAGTEGKSVVATDLLVGSRFIKVKLMVGRGRKTHDKRQHIKKRDQMRDVRNFR